MPVDHPFRRTVRQFVIGEYDGSGRLQCYLLDPRYRGDGAEHYIRSLALLQDDLFALFDYVEPADENRACYSFRIHSLLLRTCVELEANCKAILLANEYAAKGDWSMRDYMKIEGSHRLSSYQVRIPQWSGAHKTRAPFQAWKQGGELSWYQAYNATKHDRYKAFKQANLDHLVDAFCGLLVVLSAQFHTHEFSSLVTFARRNPNDFVNAIGRKLLVRFPSDWPDADKYEFFDWGVLEQEKDPFRNFPYP